MIKKILCFCLFVLSTFSFSGEIISQKKLLENYKVRLENSNIYEKYKNIYAREAVKGEIIYTITKDGLETKNIAKAGDIIIKNQTGAKEEYIQNKKKFTNRYTYLKEHDNIWKEYKPLGMIKALKVKTKEPFFIMANWGEKMIVKDGDWLVSPLDYSEIYRIANYEFFETYQISNSK